ncbi:MAG: iron ABC transporter permease, partial [Pseudorhodobacter sp.]|nr:iron ABC transporter permease [Pseudorhodobacter sp.]
MRTVTTERASHPVLTFWVIVGWAGYLLLPWYGVEDFYTFEWLFDGWPTHSDYAPAMMLIAAGKKLWLAPMLLALIAPLFVMRKPKTDPLYGKVLIVAGGFGFAWLVAQGLGIGLRGYSYDWMTTLFGVLDDRQFGMGYGALLVATAFLFLFTQGIAARGAVNGDVFVTAAIGGVIAVVAIFVFFPIVKMLGAAFVTDDGGYSIVQFFGKFVDRRIWGLGCLSGGRCGSAWNSLLLAVLVGVITTALGLVFALVLTRSGFKYKQSLRALTVLPIITRNAIGVK